MADIDIFGTLNNATPDGVLARADQIKDEAQNKKQSEINAEVKEQIEKLSQGGSGGGIEDAPSDGKTYGRKDGGWTTTEEVIDLGTLAIDPNDTSTFSVLKTYLSKVGVYKFKRSGWFSYYILNVFVSGYFYGGPIMSAILTVNEAGNTSNGNYHPEYWGQSVFIYTEGEWQRKVYVISELNVKFNSGTFPQDVFDSLKQNGLYKLSSTLGQLTGTINITEHKSTGAIYQSLHAYINDTDTYVLDGFRKFKDGLWSEWKTAKTALE